jgi:hypothetical protein
MKHKTKPVRLSNESAAVVQEWATRLDRSASWIASQIILNPVGCKTQFEQFAAKRIEALKKAIDQVKGKL